MCIRWAALVLVLGCGGCGNQMRSVRAFRQHGREPAKAKAVVQRVADFRAGLRVVDRLLSGTGYGRPGELAKALEFDDATADRLRAQLERSGLYADTSLRVPIATLYQVHAEAVFGRFGDDGRTLLAQVQETFGAEDDLQAIWATLTTAREALAAAQRQAEDIEEQISKLDAKRDKRRIAQLKGRLAIAETRRDGVQSDAVERREAFERSISSVRFHTNTAQARAVLDDLVAVLSVGARLVAEVAALVPVVTVQAYGAARDLKRNPKRAAELIGLALSLHGIDADLAVLTEGLYVLAEKVADAAGRSLSDTAGFLYAESASDLVRGFAFDSFYFDMRGGAEVLFFHNGQRTGDQNDEENESKVTYDLSNQRFRLEYAVDPIVLATFSLDLGLDLLNVPGLIQFDLGYKTDRVYRSGGTIERSQDALGALGATGTASDVLSAGIALLGLRASVETARFNAGTVRLVNTQTGQVEGEAPFELERLKVGLDYDLMWVIDSPKLRSVLDALDLGFRYMTYSLPRIVYEFEDRNGNAEQDDWVLIGESDPQQVKSTFYMGGVMARGAWAAGRYLRLPIELGVYLGGGPADYIIGATADEGERDGDALAALVMPARFGFAFTFADPRSRLQIDLEIIYQLELIVSSAGKLFDRNEEGDEESDLGDRKVDFGGVDVFHGPTARLRMTF